MSRRFSLPRTLSSFWGEEKKDDDADVPPEGGDVPSFLSSSRGPRVAAVLEERGSSIRDDSFLKIVRQLEFWHGRGVSDDDFLALARRLADTAGWRARADDDSVPAGEKFSIPKVRFGRTEIQMPIVTCGGMRLQETWIPDTIPLVKPNKDKVVKSKSQDNLRDVIVSCIKLGLNHFETARYYGSSEVQFVEALGSLIDDGTIKRSDFIFQTKLPPLKDREAFEKSWKDSWSNVSRLGYVDLLTFHCVSDAPSVEAMLKDGEDSMYGFLLELKEEGLIKHIGFSTHQDAENNMRMIESDRFDYVNLHKHFFGDYHAAGTPDGRGGQGNAAAVKRALELDMGVFNISPFDKGGKLYRPSAKVAAAIGPGMSPIAFAALHAWKTQGMHTVSVGLARSSDLDEVVEAARMYAEDDEAEEKVGAAETRLRDLFVETVGEEWYRKGLLNLPSFYDRSSDGMAIGHMLWLHDCLEVYGMHEFAKDRYKSLEASKWSKKLTYEENLKKGFKFGNPGRSYDSSVDLTEALNDHYDPETVKRKIAQVHKWLNKDATVSEDEQSKLGWRRAYSLTTWEEFPGEVVDLSNVLLSRMGLKGGKGNQREAAKEAEVMRGIVRRASSKTLAT